MSKSAAPEEKQTQTMELLRELQRWGMLDSMVSTVRQEATQMPVGAMTDGSKRRLSESVNWEEEEDFHHVAADGEMPPFIPGGGPPVGSVPAVFHVGGYESGQSPKISLPDGVSSLEDWGRTVCELPKVRELSCSYKELMMKAEEGDTQMSKYLSWIRSYKGPSSRTVDFKNYLLAVDSCAAEPKTYFPGTMEVRRLK